jgi:hypothetical protein
LCGINELLGQSETFETAKIARRHYMKRNRLLAGTEITVICIDAPMQLAANGAFVEIVADQSRDGIFITYTFAVFEHRIFEVVAFLFETATKYVHSRPVYIVSHNYANSIFLRVLRAALDPPERFTTVLPVVLIL